MAFYAGNQVDANFKAASSQHLSVHHPCFGRIQEMDFKFRK